MTQLTRPVQLFMGFAFMVFGPFWASVVDFMTGLTVAYVIGAYFFGFGLAMVLFGTRWVLLFGSGAVFGLVAYALLSLTGALA